MKDIIDLGNLVFDQLVIEHGELEESRVLFLYDITKGNDWQVLNDIKVIRIDNSGVTKNFEDLVIEKLNDSWRSVVSQRDSIASAAISDQMKSQIKELKDGDIIEFGKSSGPWREIPFNL